MSNILLLETSGSISLDAIRWCKDEDIAITIVDYNGELLQALLPDGKSDVKLRLLQYKAYSDAKLRGMIACDIVTRKIKAQLETLKLYPRVYPEERRKRAIQIFNDAIQWLDMKELPERFYNIDWLMSYEGRCASVYWQVFGDIPLLWSKPDRKLIPPHYLIVGDRTSLMTKSDNARNATSIFQASLNYAYAVLKRQCLQAINSTGLDPEVSFLHSPQDNRPSLALDLMEQFRPLIDVLVLDFFSEEKLTRHILMQTGDGSIRFQPQFLRYFIVKCTFSQEPIDEAAKDLRAIIAGTSLSLPPL